MPVRLHSPLYTLIVVFTWWAAFTLKPVQAESDASEVNLGPIGVLPVWLVIIIAIILAALVSGFGYLLWRRYRGDRVDPEIGLSRFRESGNWKKRWSRAVKPSPSSPFRAGTILGGDPVDGGRGESSHGKSQIRIGSAKLGKANGEVHSETGPAKPSDSLSRGRSRRRRSLERAASRKGAPQGGEVTSPAYLQRQRTAASSHGMSDRDIALVAATTNFRDSTETLEPDEDILSMMKASGRGDLGLGSGFVDLPTASVVAIEEEKIEVSATMRSARTGADGLTRSNTSKSNISRKDTKRASSRRRGGNDISLRGSPPNGEGYLSSSGTDGRNDLILPPAAHSTGRERTFDGEDLVRSRSAGREERHERSSRARSSSRSRTTYRGDRVARDARDDSTTDEYEADRSRQRQRSMRKGARGHSNPREESAMEENEADRSRRRGTSRSRTRNRSSSRAGRPRVHGQSSDSEGSDSKLPIQRSVNRHRSLYESESQCRSSSVDPSRRRTGTGKKAASRSQSIAPQRNRRRHGDQLAGDDTPLATVALQVLQQNLTRDPSRGRAREHSGRERYNGSGRPTSTSTEVLVID
ncbi:uncharacterized protein SPPG_05873 [Spizellomyces punctatus DAOM BR117]|uniref:Uncharacterized protein n=1 Tax=Spizellomyces punctatus (strain DAOM BR117) TaxID=645134 RepID=A0A0L0HD64_SPIPD|nr:uncharacterized protein SPPG_05873 [Spizellomyces punctatus DAOM BR117]KNC98909.1 hypothetical protein SPPG_05873 [Spizellomyces punctatus DAOM BR117]|eukprot:XP_016606949.1 hypothetical protein SPPG_05873 [Spizellomyces punctatus DAOM BR117]